MWHPTQRAVMLPEYQVVCVCVFKSVRQNCDLFTMFLFGSVGKDWQLFWPSFSYACKRNIDLTCYIITLKPTLGSSPSAVSVSIVHVWTQLLQEFLFCEAG